MPDARVKEESIDTKIREHFNRSRNPCSAKDVCYELEALSDYLAKNDCNLVSEDCTKTDYVEFYRHGDVLEMPINHRYNEISLCGLGYKYNVSDKHKDFDVFTAFSEQERNDDYSVFDLFIKIKDNSRKKVFEFPFMTYSVAERLKHGTFFGVINDKLKNYLINHALSVVDVRSIVKREQYLSGFGRPLSKTSD